MKHLRTFKENSLTSIHRFAGKGESSIDHTFHYGNLTHLGFDDPHATDVAADSYHRYKEDVAAAAELKVRQ